MARTLLGRSTSLDRAWQRRAAVRCRASLGAATMVVGIVLLAGVRAVPPARAGGRRRRADLRHALAWIFAVPVSVVADGRGLRLVRARHADPRPGTPRGTRSLRRSADVVRGHWWRTFGALLLTLVITILAQFRRASAAVRDRAAGPARRPSGAVRLAAPRVRGHRRGRPHRRRHPDHARSTPGVIALLYADRRMRREAFDLELQMDPPADPIAAWLPGPLTAAGSGRQPNMPRGAPSGSSPPARPGRRP